MKYRVTVFNMTFPKVLHLSLLEKQLTNTLSKEGI